MAEKDTGNKLYEYYKKACEAVNKSPDLAVNYSRKAAEHVCKQVISRAGRKPGTHATIEDLLRQIHNSDIRLDPKAELGIRTIQLFSNYSAHDQESALTSDEILPCLDAFTALMHLYYQNISLSLAPGRQSFSSTIMIPENAQLRIGKSDLTVPASIILGWNCDEVLSHYHIQPHYINVKWNDRILDQLSEGTLDLSIYNRESTKQYMQTHPDAQIGIIRDVCSSMGGRNFYILAKADEWEDMTLKDFKEALRPGTIIAVSRNSDMEKNLFYVLDCTYEELKTKGVRILDYHSSDGLSIFETFPDMLLIAGQDLRFLAERTGQFREIINYDDLPLEKRDFFNRNSINSLVIGKNIYPFRDDNVIMGNIINELMINFYSNNISMKNRDSLIGKLRPQVRQICDDDETADYIIRRILFETYRFF